MAIDAKLELAQLIRGRSEGWWGLVATVIGDELACARTTAGLSRDALTANFGGPASSPTIVGHRIQALAARDRQRLVALSRTWKGATEISLDIMNAEADFWTAAWRSSLRFLQQEGEVATVPESELPRQLAAEFAILFRPLAPTRISSWEEARDVVMDAGNDYGRIRQLDASKVRFDKPAEAAQLLELVGSNEPSPNELERLRFFFGRAYLIGEDGRSYLRHLLEKLWRSDPEPTASSTGVGILSDLVLELEGPAGPPRELVDNLLSALARSDAPEPLLPLVYLFFGHRWRHP